MQHELLCLNIRRLARRKGKEGAYRAIETKLAAIDTLLAPRGLSIPLPAWEDVWKEPADTRSSTNGSETSNDPSPGRSG
jgi:hypothetical protein